MTKVEKAAHNVRTPSTVLDHRETFWVLYIRVGFVVLGSQAAAAAVYFDLSPGVRNRSTLLILAAGTVGASAAGFALSRWVAQKDWRPTFSMVTALVVGVLLTVCCALDTGIDSPLVYLAAMPIIYASLALSARSVIVCGSLAFGEVSILTVADPSLTSADSKLLIMFAFIGGITCLAIVYSLGRTRLERDEAAIREELARLADTDSVTGALNHRAFYTRLKSEIDRFKRYGDAPSLLIADVDFFKSFNDANGHQAGDSALAQLTGLMEQRSRTSDVVARIGGDEFAVILPSTPLTVATGVAERLLREVESSSIGITLSLGVAAVTPSDPTVKRVVRDADAALYRAKALGRRQIATTSQGGSGPDDPMVGNQQRCSPENLDLLNERMRQSERERAEALARMDAMFQAAPIGMGFVDADFRILQLNETLAAVNGAPKSEQLGRTVAEVVPSVWPQLEPAYQDVLRSGRPLTIDDISGETHSDPGIRHYWRSTLFPVRVDGKVIGMGVTVLDVTDRKNLEQSTDHLLQSMAAALARAVEERDPYTAGHQERVAEIAEAMARDLGWDSEAIQEVTLAARMHDVGKIRVPTEILSRPGRLSEPEMALVRLHSSSGYDILRSVDMPLAICRMVLQHHERLDGSGYPNGLRAEDISAGARLIAVADVAEAMTAVRPYRAALGQDSARDELRNGRWTLYDGDVVDAYLRVADDASLLEKSGL
jgi:diguanylate cyclase (GGDEF)-like protein/PAS domain S-box-containing protein/putative nucleotidyltransferase with HDIG domain